MSDIFDLSSIDDIPEKVKEGISIDIFAVRIIELFEIAKRPLNVDELTVGYYRKFNSVDEEGKTKRQITVKVYNMSKEKNSKIKSVAGKKGVYELKQPTTEIPSPSYNNDDDIPF